jgi:hypothetical protein
VSNLYKLHTQYIVILVKYIDSGIPSHSGSQKYSTVPNRFTSSFFPSEMPDSIKNLIHASVSKSAWAKNECALKSFEKFERHENKKYSWPLGTIEIQKYIGWAIGKEQLKHTTVKSYLSSIGFLHNIKGLDSSNCKGFIPNQSLKGAANMMFYKSIASESRKVMTLPILKILGHQLALSDLEKHHKQVLWTLFTVAFFGSFRMGELLCPSEHFFIPEENLLWKDVAIQADSVIIKIKIPKNRTITGEVIDLFKVKGSCCPVQSVKKLKMLVGNRPDSPVFSLDSGKFLTPPKVNSYLKSLLTPIFGVSYGSISGHSFRAGIPSVLSNNPEVAREEEIMSWGRWSSNSYKAYTRLSANQKRAIFNKITSAL